MSSRFKRLRACRELVLAAALALAGAAAAQDGPPGPSAGDLEKVRAAEAARIVAVQKVYGSVVAIYGNNRQGGGSGVLISPDGLAMTNFHVVRAAGEEGWGGLADGKLYRWKIVGVDPGGDLAIVRLTGQSAFPCARLGDSDLVQVGDWVMAMGNPFVLSEDQKPTVTLGIVSGIERFQPGEGGKSLLVYGNCIQVSSSINPGNSGGPLFNMAARVIGINGRGSFEERGRVNVGVGYAVSSAQMKNFIPELEAGKMCQHATLDATFRDQEGTVICDSVNLDGLMGQAGLELSDRLVSFDGKAIASANQYTNLISLLPAGWPVEVVWERAGQLRRDWVRLEALPYDGQQKKPPRGPATRPAATQPLARATTRPATTRPAAKPWEPGQIHEMQANRDACARILRDWTAFRGGPAALAAVKAFRVTEDVLQDGKKLGSRTILWTTDGRQKVERSDAQADVALSLVALSVKDESLLRFAGMESFDVSPAAVAAAVGRDLQPADFVKLLLQGGDKTQGQRAYRLLAEDKQGRRTVLWFSLLRGVNEFETRLLKAATADAEGKESAVGLTFSDYRAVGGVMLPHRQQYVAGLMEKPLLELVVTACEPLNELPADAF